MMDSDVCAICSASSCIAATASSIAATLGGVSGSAGVSAGVFDWEPPQAVREMASAVASKSKRVCFIKNPPHVCF